MTDRHALAMECARIEKAGGSVREYLKGKGYVSPWGTWHRLQKEELGRSKEQITEGKGNDHMKDKKLRTMEEKMEIILAAVKAGRHPFEALKETGYTAPEAVYSSCRNWAKEHAPEMYAALPENLRTWSAALKKQKKAGTKKEPETVTGPDGKKYEKLELEGGKNYTVSVEEKVPEIRKQAEEKELADYETSGVRNEVMGNFFYDRKYGVIEWRTPEGEEMNMLVGIWKKLAKDLPEILRALGVDPV